jgi:hypothetical protein
MDLEKIWDKKIWFIPILIIILFIILINYQLNNCGMETYGLSGNFTGWKIFDEKYGGYLLYIENGTYHFEGGTEKAYHIEHWFSDIGNYDLDNYIGKNIKIEYISGCGQTIIKNIIKG